MGRYPLLTLTALTVLACEPVPPGPRTAGDSHAGLACTECHNGGLADRSQAAVPDISCMSSGCHATSVPNTVTLSTVRFTHLDHGGSGTLKVGCAGCHTHASGDEPISAGSATCGLCHEDAVAATRGDDCRLCHATPDHIGMTSQGVQVPHQGLPWIEGGCLRCHYAVAQPVHEVSVARCVACHTDADRVTAAGIGEDLHPTHDGISCISCHQEDNHRIQAMSSAVDLECTVCHSQEHGMDVTHGWQSSQTCISCHRRIHEGPQRVLLGIIPDVTVAAPSQHFMDGLTCRSCHIPREARTDVALSGTAQACVQCHRAEYATVLQWWNQGIDERVRLVDRYLAGAEGAVAGRSADDPARQATTRARMQLNLIREAGGQHNLPLAHRIFENAVADASEAYRLAGRGAPPAPQLGRAPRQGICTFCHYRLDEPGFSATMNDAFHREVLGGR